MWYSHDRESRKKYHKLEPWEREVRQGFMSIALKSKLFCFEALIPNLKVSDSKLITSSSGRVYIKLYTQCD